MIILPDGHPDRVELTVNGKKFWVDYLHYQWEAAWKERHSSPEAMQRYTELLNKLNNRNKTLLANGSPTGKHTV